MVEDEKMPNIPQRKREKNHDKSEILLPMTFKKIVELAAKENATNSTATTATAASHEMRNKPTREEQTKAGDPEPFGDFMGDEFGLPYNQTLL